MLNISKPWSQEILHYENNVHDNKYNKECSVNMTWVWVTLTTIAKIDT